MTIGPPGAGKTTYCQKVVTANLDIPLVSADAFFMQEFGKIGFDPYNGELHYVWRCFWEHVRRSMESVKAGSTLILDCWNPTPHARREMQKRLRDDGAGKIIGWYFITSPETCRNWWVKREYKGESADSLEFTRRSRCQSARRFHQEAHDVRAGAGFDMVRCIDTQQLQLFSDVFPL